MSFVIAKKRKQQTKRKLSIGAIKLHGAKINAISNTLTMVKRGVLNSI